METSYRKKKITFALLSFLIIIYGLIIFLVITNHMGWFDLPISNVIQRLESPVLTNLMEIFTFIGSSTMVITISITFMIFLFFFFKYRYELIFFAISIIGSSIINVVLKNIIQRERPTSHRIIDALGFSFPSGHSMAAFTLYVTLAYMLWKHADTNFLKLIITIGSTLIILLIGISRIYLGVHYPSDVIGGYITSVFWLLIITKAYYFIQNMDLKR